MSVPMKERILIAGIGNIFLGDDAFGVEVVRRLAARKLPDAVRVVDFGIRGFDLAYALMEGYEVTILVDATPRGGEPGTLYTIEPDLRSASAPQTGVSPAIDAHSMDPLRVLGLVKALGGEFKRILDRRMRTRSARRRRTNAGTHGPERARGARGGGGRRCDRLADGEVACGTG